MHGEIDNNLFQSQQRASQMKQDSEYSKQRICIYHQKQECEKVKWVNLPELENSQDKIILLSAVNAKKLALCLSNPKRVGQFIVEGAIRNTNGMNDRHLNRFLNFLSFRQDSSQLRARTTVSEETFALRPWLLGVVLVWFLTDQWFRMYHSMSRQCRIACSDRSHCSKTASYTQNSCRKYCLS